MNLFSNILKFNSNYSVWMMRMLLLFGFIGAIHSNASAISPFHVERTIVLKDVAQRIIRLEEALDLDSNKRSSCPVIERSYSLHNFQKSIQSFLFQWEYQLLKRLVYAPLSPPKLIPEEDSTLL